MPCHPVEAFIADYVWNDMELQFRMCVCQFCNGFKVVVIVYFSCDKQPVAATEVFDDRIVIIFRCVISCAIDCCTAVDSGIFF